VFGLALTIGLSVSTYQRYVGAASNLALHVTGSTAPADMPGAFPTYPGGRVVESFTQPAAPGSEGVVLESSDAEDAVFAFYRSALNQSPWHVNATIAYPLREISCSHGSPPDLSCSLVVQRARNRKSTQIVFEWIPITAIRR
jgi:hypothetical protein